jgi:DNA-binding winged helix-turn-helix (wHTH) protein
LSATQQLLRFGVFELNLDTEELRKSEILLKLPPQPFRLLVLLASRAGQIVGREDIRREFWSEETDIDFERRMNQGIKQIRTALGDNAGQPLYLETVHRP